MQISIVESMASRKLALYAPSYTSLTSDILRFSQHCYTSGATGFTIYLL